MSGMEDDLLFDAYVPLNGSKPSSILNRHPYGNLAALRASSMPFDQAGVWDVSSGALIWAPNNTIALCWLDNGQQILLVRYLPIADAHYYSDVSHSDSYTYICERFSWPQRIKMSQCTLSLPQGWPDYAVVSPRNDLAAIRWLEQDSAGFVLVRLQADGDAQVMHAGYQTQPFNLMQGPVFSPDGQFIVTTCGRNLWWAGDEDGEDPEVPARGGRYTIGHIAIYNIVGGSVREIIVEDDVVAGWLPDDFKHLVRYELLSEPRFVSNSEFVVTLPTGTAMRIMA